MLPTPHGDLAKAPHDQMFKLRRHTRRQFTDWLRFLVEDRRQDGSLRFAGERAPSRYHFVEHRAETEEIASGVQLFSLCLLGGHIGGGAHYRPIFGIRVKSSRGAVFGPPSRS